MAESAPLSQSQKSGGRKLLMSRNRLFVAELYKARPMLAVRRFLSFLSPHYHLVSPLLPLFLVSSTFCMHAGYVVNVVFIV